MGNPWDRPDLPSEGTLSIDSVYAGIGKVTSEWESVEIQLCRIYSFFVLRPDDRMVMHDYGEPKVFSVRFVNLKRKAEAFFCSHPNQGVEAEFDRLADAIEGFSNRRNDVAHGVVYPAQIYKFHSKPQPGTNYYLLFPPHHKWRGHGLEAIPAYAYGAEELSGLALAIGSLYAELTEFRETLRAIPYER